MKKLLLVFLGGLFSINAALAQDDLNIIKRLFVFTAQCAEFDSRRCQFASAEIDQLFKEHACSNGLCQPIISRD